MKKISVDQVLPVYIPGRDRIYQTAVQELKSVLPGAYAEMHANSSDTGCSISLSIWKDLEKNVAQELIENGRTNLHNLSSDLDAYEITSLGNTLYLLGTTACALFQAVYEIQENVKEQGFLSMQLQLERSLTPAKRVFHQRIDHWPGTRSDIRYISHLGANACLLVHDWDKNRNLQCYVTASEFPDAVNKQAVQENCRKLHKCIEDCLDYGIEPYLWITELPCQGGKWVKEEVREQFLNRYSPEVLSDSGTNEGKVLCFGHPRVQAYYRELIHNFLLEFPQISTFFLFGNDSGGEFCDPKTCSRCAGMSRIQQRNRFIEFFLKEGREIRPKLRVLTTSWYWEQNPNEFITYQKKLPSASGLYMAAENDGWQCERQNHDFLRLARKVCKEKDQLFIGYDNFHWGDDSVHRIRDIQDFPIGIFAKMKRWYFLQVDGVFDHWGGKNQDIPCNSLFLRESFLNPLADPQEIGKKIAVRQFGEDAGKYVLEAWNYLEQAHRILSNWCIWCPDQWPEWYIRRCGVPVPGLDKPSNFCVNQLPEKEAQGWCYNHGKKGELWKKIGDAWKRAFPFFEQASNSLEVAQKVCSRKTLFYDFWWNGEEKTPTPSEHICRQKLYVKSVSLFGREIGLHMMLASAYARGAWDVDSGKDSLVIDLLHQEIAACNSICSFLSCAQKDGDIDLNDNRIDLYKEKSNSIQKYLLSIK